MDFTAMLVKLVETGASLITGQSIAEVTPEQLAKTLATTDPPPAGLLIDLRESGERQREGVIPGSFHVPFGRLARCCDPSSPDHMPELDPQRPLVLYCAVGGRSAVGVTTLQRLGYTAVSHLAGGIRAWRAAGYRVGSPPATDC